ncbi:hypothetical protein [Lysobacter silvisoli]|uniref:Uncharacterized protein n=1 Tax=Lysobacter silvisoli TaxID=2293254 RepID=A0A371K642_9GAMM|nr:hypothetical protein [Lysobacter silvisoli]RDZ29423.1 hypothetical protein DX914_10175 [Lysobacter silvisoli]
MTGIGSKAWSCALVALCAAGAAYAADGGDRATAQTSVPTATSGAAQAQPTTVPLLGGFLRETRVVYPLRVGKWQAMDERRYDRQEFGVSVRYTYGSRRDRWIDVYFYPAGLLSQTEFEQAALEERDALLQIGRQPGGYESMDMGELQAFASARGRGDGSNGRSVDLAYTHQGERKHSAMTLQLDRMYLIKGRYSVAAKSSSRAQARSTLEDFVGDLSRKLTLASTGRCWDPLPIETLQAGTPAPQGALSTLAKDGVDSAYLMSDRVIAREPQSTEAQALQTIGMGLAQRLRPGCQRPEEIEQNVPQDMREIRLEYTAPSDAPADPSRLLRSSKIDVG